MNQNLTLVYCQESLHIRGICFGVNGAYIDTERGIIFRKISNKVYYYKNDFKDYYNR